jgi:hypothetical protein
VTRTISTASIDEFSSQLPFISPRTATHLSTACPMAFIAFNMPSGMSFADCRSFLQNTYVAQFLDVERLETHRTPTQIGWDQESFGKP